MRTDLVAIDVHVHPTSPEAVSGFGSDLEAMGRYFGRSIPSLSIDELAEQYRAQRMMAVLLAMDSSTTSGRPPVPNDHIASAVRAHPDVFIGFAGVDPWKGRLAVDEARRAREVLGLRGLKLHPGLQKFAANDERIVYSVAHELTNAGQVSQASYDAARDLLGEAGLVELVSLCGYYTLISYLLNAFAVPLPPGAREMWAAAENRP